MNQFPTIRKLDSTILYALELMSSLSVILLSLGLILSMSNVLTAGAILSDSVFMSRVWSVGQTVALDTGLSGAVFRVFVLAKRTQYVQMSLYLVLSAMLLFTAVIVSNIESLQQTLNITLAQAYTHSPIPVEALVWMRSFSIVLLIIGHAVKHADGIKGSDALAKIVQSEPERTNKRTEEQPVSEQVIVTEDVGQKELEQPEQTQSLPAPKKERVQRTDIDEILKRIHAYMLEHPNATARQAASDLSMSPSTANKYMRQIKEAVTV